MQTSERSAEAGDLANLIHPVTELRSHQAKGPLMIDRAKGVRVWDDQGKEYIDAMAGLWCTALGYGDEELAQTAGEATRKLSYSQLFAGRSHESAVRLAEKLIEMTPFSVSKVFFGCSGSDANDTQIKLAWYYNNARGRPLKKKIISRHKAYHGVTIGAASLTGLKAFHESFDGPVLPVRHVSCPHYSREHQPGETEAEFVDRLAKELDDLILAEGPDTVAAFIAEPIIGAGGVIVPPEGYFQAIQRVLDRHDVLLIADEVICGFGRTGNPFGSQTVGMDPDTVSLAKALSSGYAPISAVLIPEWMYEVLESESAARGTFGHGFTYSGHPVCTAVALRTLEIYEERKIFDQAAVMGRYLQARMAELLTHPLVGEVRGAGMIGAIQIGRDASTLFDAEAGVGQYFAERCIHHGVLTRASGDSLALCPPLVATQAEIDEMFDRIALALQDTLEKAQRERWV